MPTVSIITPTYNRPELLREAIQSVRAQTYEDWEMLIIDDGSEPASQPVVDAFDDPRLRYVQLPHVGRSAARNRGLELARGEYIGFLDDDDLFHPNKLELEVSFLNTHPEADIVGSGYRITYNTGTAPIIIRDWQYKPEITMANCLFGIPLIMCSLLIQRRAIERMDYWYNTDFDMGEDSDFLRRLFLTRARFAWLREVLSDYRQWREKDLVFYLGLRQSYRESLRLIFRMNNLPKEIADQQHAALVRYDLHSAWRAYASRTKKTAHWFLLQAFIQEPRLADEKIQALLEGLATFPQRAYLVEDPVQYIDYVLNNLPVPLHFLAERRSQILQMVA